MILTKPKSLESNIFHYCAGCSHGIVHRLIAEVVDELGLREKAVAVAPVGCAVFLGNYLKIDTLQAAHGRAPAVATGVKRVEPKNLVFTYQGDGDLASIGMAEYIHSAIRGELITIIFINNACYGMTGGQMAPTTLIGQKTTTTPDGRSSSISGFPVLIPEMLSQFPGCAYIERVSVHNPRHIQKTKKAIKKAFIYQIKELGFTMVEVVSTCPTNWNMSPLESLDWVEDVMLPYYPLGVIKDLEGE